MSQYVLAILCFLAYIIIYYLIGVAFSKIFKLENDMLREVIYGMFVYGIIFFIYVLPLKFKLVPVDVIGKIWAIIMGIICVLIVVLLRRFILESIMSASHRVKEHKVSFSIISFFTIVQVMFIELFERLVDGFNQVWFLAWPSNGVFHNELMTYDTSSGTPLESFLNERYLCTFLDHSAVISKLIGLHPMVEVRTVLAGIFMLIECLLVWEIAKYFGKDNERKSIFAFLLFFAIKNTMVGSQVLPTYYSYFRNYEGKGMVMNLPIPLMVLLLLKMYDNPEDTGLLWKSAVVLWGGMTYSLSMMFTYPFVFAAYLPFVLFRKDKRMIRNAFVLIMICGVFFVVYYMGWKGILIDLTIRRAGD